MNTDGVPQPASPFGHAGDGVHLSVAPRRWIACAVLVIALHVLLLGSFVSSPEGTSKIAAPPPISIDLPKQTPKLESLLLPNPPPTTVTDQKMPQATKPGPSLIQAPRKNEPKRTPLKTHSHANLAKASSATAAAPRKTQPASTPAQLQSSRTLNFTPDETPRAPTGLVSAPESSDESGELESYRQVLTGYVIHHAIYPSSALLLRQQGIAYVDFVIDRDGRILGYHLSRSSGIAAIDNEALAIFERAQPFPGIPPDLQAPLSLTMPFQFILPR